MISAIILINNLISFSENTSIWQFFDCHSSHLSLWRPLLFFVTLWPFYQPPILWTTLLYAVMFMVSTYSRCVQCNILRSQTCHASNPDSFLHSLHSYFHALRLTREYISIPGREEFFPQFLPQRIFDFEPIYSPVQWTWMVKLPQHETYHSPVVWRVTCSYYFSPPNVFIAWYLINL